MTGIELTSFATTLRADDPVVFDHRVHGMPILPGVVYLDILQRAALAAGHAQADIELRDILFHRPLTLPDGTARIIFRVDPVTGQIDIEAARQGSGGEPTDPPLRIAECVAARTDAPEPVLPPLVPTMGNRPLQQMYEHVRGRSIVHRGFMCATGHFDWDGDNATALLGLGPEAAARASEFLLHPTFLDAATIVPFVGCVDPDDDSAYIPMYLGRFRAWQPTPDEVILRSVVRAVDGRADVMQADILLTDTSGALIAEYRNLTAKRVRSDSDLYRSLGTDPGAVTREIRPTNDVIAAPPVTGPTDRAALVTELRQLIAEATGLAPAEIATDAGFYELGVDSARLLQMTTALESRLGRLLYPTLLFEHQTIDALADHLADATTFDPPQNDTDSLMVFGFDWEPATTTPETAVSPHALLVFDTDAAPYQPNPPIQTIHIRPGDVFATQADGYTIDPADPKHMERLLRHLSDRGLTFDAAIYRWNDTGPDATTDPAQLIEQGYLPLRDLMRALAESATAAAMCPIVLAVSPATTSGALFTAMAGGLARTARRELPHPKVAAVLYEADADLPRIIAAEIARAPEQRAASEIRFWHGLREVRVPRERTSTDQPTHRYKPNATTATDRTHSTSHHDGPEPTTAAVGTRQLGQKRPDVAVILGGTHQPGDDQPTDVAVITGGMGGIGRMLARRLAGRGGRLVLAARHPLDETAVRLLRELHELGGSAIHVTADVTVAADVQRLAEVARAHFGRIDVVYHCAGELRDGMLLSTDRDSARTVLGPKLIGAANLLATMSDAHRLVLFSSLAGIVGNPGQSDYAAANRYLDVLAEQSAGQPGPTVVSLAWPVWAEGGMRPPAAARRALRDMGFGELPTEVGLDLVLSATDDHAQSTVVWGQADALRDLLGLAPVLAAQPWETTFTPADDRGPAIASNTVAAQATAITGPAQPPAARTAIAVVGMAGRYPGAENLDEFWHNLVTGHDAVGPVPPGRRLSDGHPGADSIAYKGGFLEDVAGFDPLFFRIPPATAALLDPQERLFLEQAYAALEHAGYQPGALGSTGDRVGVFVGVTWADYRLLGVEATQAESPVAVASLPSSIANRVSYCLGLRGPSLVVDTACSSSLTALHLARRSILDGDCDAALVGGVNLLLHPDKFVLLDTLGMRSATGQCRPFGADADGYVPGEGAGALYLKPLDAALADGDTIYGLLTGSAINHGGHSAGYSVPHPGAQAEAVDRALREAGVDPADIGYLEAHGSGTALGDPIEIAGLRTVFDRSPGQCAIGSTKSSIGHLESAAGIAGLTRVLLQLQHGRIAPTLHADPPNPQLGLAESRFYLPQQAEDWPRPMADGSPTPRRAGVSAFGAGGANAHVVVEEFLDERVPGPAAGAQTVVLSARTETQLHEYARALAARLRDMDPAEVGDAARTLQQGRPALYHRFATVAESPAAAADALEQYLAGQPGRWFAGEISIEPSTGTVDLTASSEDAAEAWVAGRNVDWQSRHGAPVRRIALPGYPFERRVCWIGPTPTPTPTSESPSAPGKFIPTTRLAIDLNSSRIDLGRYAATLMFGALTQMGLTPGEWPDSEIADRLHITPRHRRYLAYCLETLTRHGFVERHADRITVTGPAPGCAWMRADLLARFPQTAPYVRLLDACAAHCADVLRGTTSATEVLFPHGDTDLVAGIYRGNAGYDFTNGLVADFVAKATRERASAAPVRILEVGAGTGATTHAVLAALAPLDLAVEYHYTDVSPSFLAHGRREFSAYPQLRFGVLDIERDPAPQGFEAGSFDLVLAANVLHATTSIATSLDSVRRLLTTDGVLALSELTADLEAVALTFGLLDGWHGYSDPELRLPHSPLLSETGWRNALSSAGFTDLHSYGPGLTADAEDPGFRLLTAVSPVPALAPPGTEPALHTVAPDTHSTAADPEPELIALVATTLGMTTADIRADRSFADYGVDSILAVRLVEQVNSRYGLALRPTVLFEYPSVRALGHRIAEELKSSRPQTEKQVPAVPHRTTPPDTMDIAIVGMSGRFPGADDLDGFWRNLIAGVDSVTEIPPDRWPVTDYYRPGPPVPGTTNSKWAGLLSDIDRFDPTFFDIIPAEADYMDPQQRLFLEHSWLALEDAAIDPTSLRGTRCGVFAGAPGSDYATLLREHSALSSHYVFTGNSPAILPARVAYHLDLTGPCVGLDTACSSALVALHQACRAIAAGECEFALAGGVSVFVTPEYHLLASALGMLSPTGRCATFDAAADGFVIAEGVGVVVLEPLADAVRRGDPIHGVIRGIAVNHDGHTNGITAPSARSQAELELAVYRGAGIDPATLGYIETHGTGTPLGDPIEIDALTTTFRRYTDRTGFIPIGSVKSNIGHASHAAGIAGLCKVLLSMRAGVLPPSIHFGSANPLLDLTRSPFYVNTAAREWPAGPRRAAVSSFGFSGTNAHLVIEDYPDNRPAGSMSGPVVVMLSARTPDRLRAAAQALRTHIAEHPDLAPADIAETLRHGRTAFEHRMAVLAHSIDELRQQLTAFIDRGNCVGGWSGAVSEVAAIDRPARTVAAADFAAGWVRGEAVALRDESAVPGRRIHLPGYRFARERCWAPELTAAAPVRTEQDRPATHVALSSAEVIAACAGIAAELLYLTVADIGADTPSGELGFDESTRAQVVIELNRRYGCDLPIAALGVTTTLAQLADRVVDQGSAPQSDTPEAATPESAATEYLKQLLSEYCRLDIARIRTRIPLQDFGIDSVLISTMNTRLEEDFGPLPSTLFFEYQTILELAGYFAAEHGERLAVLTRAPRAVPPVTATEPADAAAEPAHSTPESHPVEPAEDGIAVIGMAGRFPMAADIDEFWANLLGGRDCIVEVPPERWNHADYLSDDPDEPGTTYARWGGFIDDMDCFDARFFRISPKDADEMDPQQRLFLETCWAALEDAGYTPARLQCSARERDLPDAGVFAGVTYGEYQALINVPIAGYWAVANRVSYHLGFGGPSLAVDTACSASLSAIHLACESLRRGEAAYALAGGVNVSIHPGKYQLLGHGRWASTDGRCRSFGAGGDGYVPGEGVATLVLKPLRHARVDGDRIYGVIRSSAINHGGHTNGFTVPNPRAQADLIARTLRIGGIDAGDIGYVEAHGTGTALGDPIEIAALSKAYGAFGDKRGYCGIGSAKSSVGHLEAAAGAAGVVKALLQLRHDMIPPTLHSNPPNPGIDFAATPFRVIDTATAWPRPASGAPRLTAVSSFGAGGANAHVILADDDPAPELPSTPTDSPCVIVVSATEANRLTEAIERLVRHLRETRPRLGDVAWTLAVGRVAFEHRVAVLASTIDEAITGLTRATGRVTDDDPAVFRGVARTHRETDELPGESTADRALLERMVAAGNLKRLAKLWASGWAVDWERLYDQPFGLIVSLPTYPFARRRHWIIPEEYRRKDRSVAVTASTNGHVNGHANGRSAAAENTSPPATSETDSGELRTELYEQVRGLFAELTRSDPADLDLDADFADFGFDSIVSVRMMNRLMKLHHVRLPAEAIEINTTIRTFVDYVIDTGAITATQADESAARADGSAVADIPVVTFAEPLPIESIFVTGVTGVLGGRLLADLLEHTTARITCLVRGDTMDAAHRRIRHFLSTYDPEGKLDTAFATRVTALLGDVSLDRMGLDDATWQRLAADTDATIHVAGRTTLVTFYDALAPTNVEGTRRAVDFALATKHKYLIYVSSFSVLGDRLNGNNPPFTERDLEMGQGYDHLPYQETKYEAEKLIRAATAQGLLWDIVRPGNIMGDSRTGRYPFSEVSVKGAYYDILKTMVETGETMLTPIHWDITPVDYVSAALLHIAMGRPTYRETYHLTNPDIRRYYDIVAYVRAQGYPVDYLGIDEYHRKVTERQVRARGSGEIYESQTLEMFKYGVEIFGRVHYEESSYADCEYTRGILAAAGIECATIAELIPVYLRHCTEVDYLPAPDTPLLVADGLKGAVR
ncbi:SDR family NAD(P)-dependent oxidoreductase [Nocardia sp. NPDC020380]|uniref:SDR family NAD(P)-dependent oxidoreductase n=1 Tax=Nocardia sp. NPDC020380 TaxID=3364309 RepID=UPI0037A3DA40